MTKRYEVELRYTTTVEARSVAEAMRLAMSEVDNGADKFDVLQARALERVTIDEAVGE